MFISKGLLVLAILVIIYYVIRYNKYRRLATYMQTVPEEKNSLEWHYQKHSSNPQIITESLDFLYPKYITYMAKVYMNTGPFNDGKKQYIHSIAKVGDSSDFVNVTFFNYVGLYMDDNLKRLTTYEDERYYGHARTEIRKKGELYKKLEELRICSAEECLKIKNIHKYAFVVSIDTLKEQAAKDTVESYCYHP